MKKSPPIEKVFEAWTALADGRVSIDENSATVKSSDRLRTYNISFNGNHYSSTDNATFWQGYPGYPVIAVLMLQNKLPYDTKEAEKWKDINWKVLNTKYKNDYSKVVETMAQQREINLDDAYGAARKVLEALSKLDLEIKRKIKS